MVCLALLLALGACHHDSDQAKVRAAIADAASAARDNDAGALAQVLSDDFDARQGVLDRRRLLALLRLNAFHGEHVGVVLGPIDVQARGERMLADFTVTLSDGGRSRWLPQQLGVYQVHSAWKREHGRWRCFAASAQRKL
ncbi:hypothetical protein [Oleiagrimonas sp. C23AA]|uniref:hypothetical protein n=1 Tax=Oleiagrimonas sp. C23AA TaxID=2719047 RepID=UPI00141E800D|nr:hypothetical protein [Oleiagrimonas sp. C23AA]NII11139.1 hypothetical protein [Oleiagrimonas sp. C23AA]